MKQVQLNLKLIGFTVATFILLAFSVQFASADEDYGTAEIIISNRPGEHVAGLTWKNFKVPVRVEKNGEERRAFVDLQGSLDRVDSNLVFNEKNVPLAPGPEGTGGIFTQAIQLTGRITMLAYHFVDPYGRAQTERLVLVYPKWKKFNLPVSVQDQNIRRILMSVGLGLSYENYNEPGNIQMSEFALTPKFNIVYLLDPHHWELGSNIFINAIPFANSASGRADARWWGINGRVGYRLPIDSVPSTNFWVMTGWYVWGMYVNAPSDSTYGITYLGGPQIFVTARITPPGKKASWVYLKYASIQSGGLQIFSLTNRELAFGGGMEVSERGVKHPVSMTLDFANAAYSGINSSTGLVQSFNLDSVTFGVSIGL